VGNASDNAILGNDQNNVVQGLGGMDEIRGYAGDDTLLGGADEDLIWGDEGEDNLSGGDGVDALAGGVDNDVLNGGAGGDSMEGGEGDDVYYVDSASDLTLEASGNGFDTVIATVNHTLASQVEGLTLAGAAVIGTGNLRNNTLAGNALDNTLDGVFGHDKLSGGAGADKLYGGVGNDELTGGAGADRFWGGEDSDIFVFVKASDSTVTAGGRDVIMDFDQAVNDANGAEVIDLTAIDANTAKAGNQAFAFIGSDAFHGTAGELRFTSSGGNAAVFGDLNGDKVADFAITLLDVQSLTNVDFLL
jgi:Ca2+-binding RTX toxin-like protein